LERRARQGETGGLKTANIKINGEGGRGNERNADRLFSGGDDSYFRGKCEEKAAEALPAIGR